MSLGNAKMRKYVVHELIRRCKGRTLRRRQKGTPAYQPLDHAGDRGHVNEWSENLFIWN